MGAIVHIDIYILNDKAQTPHEKYKIGYEVEDNDKNILFSPVILKECIRDFVHHAETIILLLSVTRIKTI